jgi:DNA adenine methylase
MAVRDGVEDVIEALQAHRCEAEAFYRVRAQCCAKLPPAGRAARTIYLNRTCFNGLYRVNRRGEFNVPFGRYNNPTICNADNLRRASQALSRATLRCQPVAAVARQARRGDVIYFDPPYAPLSATANFVGYAARGFGVTDQVLLAQLFARLADRGVQVLLSNADVPLVRELYQGFRIDRVMARRSISRSGATRAPVGEVLISAM